MATNKLIETLPRDYFGDLYKNTCNKLLQGENVLIGSLRGCGGKSFSRQFLHLQRSDQDFEHIHMYDPILNKQPLPAFLESNITPSSKLQLVVIRQSQLISKKQQTMEALNGFHHQNPYFSTLAFADHTAITSTSSYFGISSVVFSTLYSILPADSDMTRKIIKTTGDFFGWKIATKEYAIIEKLSGGIARLIKYIGTSYAEDGNALDDTISLLAHPVIQFELESLLTLLLTLPATDLKKLNLLAESGSIRSELLHLYFQNYHQRLAIDLAENLTEQESRMFAYMTANKGKVVTIEHISDLLKMGNNDYSPWKIYKVISRLKKKIDTQYTIENLRGKGYRITKKD